MNDIRVCFFVNANKKIGGGHLVRCIQLANALKKIDIHSLFLVSETDPDFCDFIGANDYDYLQLDGSTQEQHRGIEKIVSPFKKSILVVDTDDPDYHSVEFQDQIMNTGSKLMIITNKPHSPYRPDILLNQNPISLEQKYDIDSRTKKLFGPEYFILPEPFRESLPERTFSHVPPYNLFISFGSVDPNNITSTILKACERISRKEIINKILVVAGIQNKNLNEIRSCIEESQLKIELHVNTSDIKALMLEADIAITAAGLTFWELASLTVPSLIIPASEREIETATYLHQNRIAYQLTTYKEISDLAKITSNIEYCMEENLINVIDFYRFEKLMNRRGIDNVVPEIEKTLKS
jgi:UDP-2,4-diacetamido-2,4,6-trideoxy-beta-L-altropyranose hydrolase